MSQFRRFKLKNDRKIMIFLVIILLIPQNVQSLETINLAYLTDFPVTGAEDILVSGTYAYIGTNNGLEILDVSSSLAPSKLSDLTFFTSGPKLFYAFPYLFSCDGTVGVNIINIADRTTPTKVTTFDTSLCIDIQVVGGYAYVADGTNGLLIIDISTIATPVLTSTINVG